MKFVLATDGSGYARIAEETLATFEAAKGATWDVVSVATPLPIAIPNTEGADYAAGDELSQAWAAIRNAHRETAEQVAARLAERGFKTSAHLLDGEPARSILDHCKEVNADVVALGSRGLGAFMGMILGSTARRLVTYSPCSVLVGHSPPGEDADRFAASIAAKPRLDILVAADGSAGSNKAIEVLGTLGHFGKGIAVCVEPLSVIPPGLNPAEFGGIYRYDSDRAMQIAEQGAQRLAAMCESVVPVAELGRPAAVLIDQATANGVDLLVLGATRHGFLERFLLGSVSHEVASGAPMPVLVVRTENGGN